MMTLVLSACPAGLRGDLTKWLMEVSPGVFVGRTSRRVREMLWERTVDSCNDGRAILVFSADNEQGLEFRTHRHNWETVDLDGLSLMLRPASPTTSPRRTGWSAARNQRRARYPSWAQQESPGSSGDGQPPAESY